MAGECVPSEGDSLALVSVEPPANAVDGADRLVRATFSAPVRFDDPAPLVVRSEVDGRLSGEDQGTGTSVLTFEPLTRMAAGSRVEVTVRGGVRAIGGAFLRAPFVYRFRVATAPAGSTFTRAAELQANLTTVRAARVVDLDEDAGLEVVVVAGVPLTVRAADIGPDGRSVELRPVPVAAGAGISDFDLGDVNGDGRTDVMIASGTPGSPRLEDTRPYVARAAGLFTPGPVASLPRLPGRLRLGDLDGDGDLDFAATILESEQGAGERIVVARGDGLGGFTALPVLGSAAEGAVARELALADLDDDGDLDLVVLNDAADRARGTVTVLMNDGRARFEDAEPRSSATVGFVNGALVTGDFDGDGDVDVAVGSGLDGTVTVLRNDGTGGLGSPTEVSATNADHLAPGDVDGDGDLDLVTSGGDILENVDGAGTLVSRPSALGGTGVVSLADLDRDGKLDAVVVRDSETTTFETHLNE